MLLVTESAPMGKRGYYGSFAQAGVPVGVVLANLAFLIVGATTRESQLLAWGWRIPFLVSIVLVALGLFVHFGMADTAVFRTMRQSVAAHDRRSPILEALRLYPRQICLAAGSFIASNLIFYIAITFVVAYGTTAAGLNLPRATMLTAVLISMCVMMPALVLFGALSDRYGRRRIYMAGTVLVGLWAFALFPMIETRSFAWITVALCVAQLFGAMMYGPQAALFAELFETRVRYSGASLGYQLGSIFGGALAPIIATSLLARFQTSIGISIYIAAACAVSLVSVTLLTETSRVELAGSTAARPAGS